LPLLGIRCANVNIQTSSYTLLHSPHTCNHRTSRSLRTLLQALLPVHSNTRLRYTACYLPRAYAGTRSVHLNASGINCHSSISTFRSLILLLSVRFREPRSEHPSAATNFGRNRILLHKYSPSQVLATTSAHTLTKFGAVERAYGHCVQCWTYAWRNNMAHSTWTRIGSLRC